MEYDKFLFINNVYALSAKRGMKIGQLEKRCDVSVGYFARLRQGEKNNAPGADFLLRIAQLLGVSVDSLLTFDFSASSDADVDLLHYIEKLTRETLARTLVWQEDGFGYPDTVPLRKDGTSLHPLFTTDPSDRGESAPYYLSKFHPYRVDLIPLKTYGVVFPGGKTLYLVLLRNGGTDPRDPEPWQELELVMTGAGMESSVPLAHTGHNHPAPLDNALSGLFRAVEESADRPQLSPEAKAIISEYLNQ